MVPQIGSVVRSIRRGLWFPALCAAVVGLTWGLIFLATIYLWVLWVFIGMAALTTVLFVAFIVGECY